MALSRYQLGERNIWCKETCFNDATHVPLMVRAPMYHGPTGGRATAMIELVDIMPTVIELARLPPFDPTKKGEPPLGGTSFAALVRNGGDGPGVAAELNASFSQYARARCVNDLFAAGKACTAAGVGHFIGYSIRTPDWRYTRWVNVTLTGDPTWSAVVGEEMYRENATSDDYDQSERRNVRYTAAADPAALEALQKALAAHHGQPAGGL